MSSLQLSDQKPLKSWSTRQSNHLTCQTVYDNLKEKYVGVINKKHICIWDEEESNLEDVKKQTVRTSRFYCTLFQLSNFYFQNLF